MYRIFIGGLLMEANSFNPVFSTRETFTCTLEGETLSQMKGTSLEMGGVFDTLEKQPDVEIVPGFYAQACTSGPVKGTEFTYLSQRLFRSLEAAGKVDGVLLVLHGAMQSENIDDCEGYIISQVRQIVGDDVPVCASFDFHALVTTQMVQGLDGASGYFTYPHVDHFETGVRACNALLELLRSGEGVYRICHRIPMIMSCENSNTIDSPMVPAMEMFQQLLHSEGVCSGSIFMAQPWLDSPQLGCSVCIFARGEDHRQALTEKVDGILTYLWEHREEFYPPMPKIDQALEKIRHMAKPVILVDYGDVPNAGGTGDGSVVLEALLKADLPETSVVVVADQESTDLAEKIGVGGEGLFHIGGFGKPGEFNQRIPVKATVLKLNPEPFVHLGPAQKGFISNPGMRALLKSGNVYIILCRRVCISHDRNMLLTMGLDPTKMDIISMRATHSFMSTYAGVYGSWIYVDTPGFSARSMKDLPFRRCGRPIYPLDDIRELHIIDALDGTVSPERTGA